MSLFDVFPTSLRSGYVKTELTKKSVLHLFLMSELCYRFNLSFVYNELPQAAANNTYALQELTGRHQLLIVDDVINST